jgi:hypothetical protein
VLVLDIIEIIPPLEKYEYDTWKILSVKCYIENSVCLRSCIRNVNMKYKCILMVAVGITTENQLLPLAFVLCRG